MNESLGPGDNHPTIQVLTKIHSLLYIIVRHRSDGFYVILKPEGTLVVPERSEGSIGALRIINNPSGLSQDAGAAPPYRLTLDTASPSIPERRKWKKTVWLTVCTNSFATTSRGFS